jgi:hypothetical protein
MRDLKQLDEGQFKVDFMISEGYIKFSSELLRLSLLAMGGFGTLVLVRLKGENKGPDNFLQHPVLFSISMVFFAFCVGACLFHRYYASDCMSWYIDWLRADQENKHEKAKIQREGFHRMLKRSEKSLIACEFLFGAGVFFFLIAIFMLLYR